MLGIDASVFCLEQVSLLVAHVAFGQKGVTAALILLDRALSTINGVFFMHEIEFQLCFFLMKG